MYIKEVSKWRVESGLLYNTCIPDKFRFVMDDSERIGMDFVYCMSAPANIGGPESHSCFGQMQKTSIFKQISDRGVTLVHIKGMNDRYDRWMEAIFAVSKGDEFFDAKLVLFERGGWYKDAGYQSQWNRFDVVGFRITSFKNPVITYNHLSVDDEGKPVVKEKSVSIQ